VIDFPEVVGRTRGVEVNERRRKREGERERERDKRPV